MKIILRSKIHTIFIILTALIIAACQREPSYVDSYVIKKDGLYGLIDSTGNEIVKPRFLSIEPIQKDGVALAIIDTIYTTVRDSSFLGIRDIPVLNIKYGYVTSDNKFLLPNPSYAKIKIENFMDSARAFSRFCQETSFYGGLAVAQDTTTFLYGYIGLNGDTIISAKYRTAYKFNEGRAAVQLEYQKGLTGSGKWGLINPDGNKVCDFIFNQIETPVNKRAIASITTINKQETETIDGEINLDSNGNAFINKSKATTIEASDDPIFSTSIFLVDENGKIINENMNMMYQYSNFSKDGIAVAIPNGLAELFGAGYRFITKDGEFLKTLDANNITEEQAEKIINSKWFLGELLPEDIEFVDATRFTDGYAAVNLGKAWIYVDKQLIPRGSEENPIYEDALPFSHGLAGIKLNGKYGYINNEFDVVIPCKYDSCAIAGKTLCRVYGGKKTDNGYSIISYINRNGKIVWQNVNYEDSYLKQADRKAIHISDDYDYSYIGKNYLPLYLIISLLTAIVIVSIILKRRKNNSNFKNAKVVLNNDVNNDTNIQIKSEHQLSKIQPINNLTVDEKRELNDNNIKKTAKPTPSIDERLDDLLDI